MTDPILRGRGEAGQGPQKSHASHASHAVHAQVTAAPATPDVVDACRAFIESDRLMGLADVPLRRRPVPAPTVSVSEPVSMPQGTRESCAAMLEELRERHDRECPHCTTATAHKRTVFGEGDPCARLMFVGEAPGETEDELGRPFVGKAGRKLDDMIQAIGLRREDCFIANVLKSRPPDNRAPLPHEVERCGPYLVEQLLIIRPRVIMTLGGPATKLLLKTDVGIMKLRGQWSQWNAPPGSPIDSIPLMPTFHPAYLLRNYTQETRSQVWSDLKAVMQRLAESA